jgi:alpha-beta hydrolase superfamily lysophospholipase
METLEWKWKTKDDLEMYSIAWLPAGEPRTAVCLIHGVGEHIGRCQPAAAALTAAGYLFTGFDQRGFGQGPARARSEARIIL